MEDVGEGGPRDQRFDNDILASKKKALPALESLLWRISALLEASNGGPRRGATDDYERHVWSFLQTELSIIVESLRMGPPPLSGDYGDFVRRRRWSADMKWLAELETVVRTINLKLDRHEYRHTGPDPCHKLLRKATRCFRPSQPRWLEEDILSVAKCLHNQAEKPSRYYWNWMHTELPVPVPVQSDDGDLPLYSNLRLLSLYMSMFPPGYKLDVDRLTIKWLHEGLLDLDFLPDERDRFMKLVYMKIITSDSEQAPNYRHIPGDIDDKAYQWQVNPSMLQSLASKSAEKCIIFTSATLASAAASAGSSKTLLLPRRLALHVPHPQLPSLLQELDLSHTRSLAVSGAIDRTVIPLERFLCLVLLDLDGWKELKDEDMLQICKMMFLSYLSVRNTGITKLPSQIKELGCLDTLDVSHTQLSELPYELFEGERYLWRLDIRGTHIKRLPKGIQRLYGLGQLLAGGDGMINSDKTVLPKIPEWITGPDGLEILATVDTSEWSAIAMKKFGNQWRLKVLAMTLSFHQCTEGDYQDALRSSFQRWRQLKSLTIHCELGCSMEFLGSLNHPPMKLEKFKVTAGRFVRVPRWIERLNVLEDLQITVCQLAPDDVKSLGDLLSLRRLALTLEFIPEEEIVIERGVFPEEEIVIERGVFPEEEIVIEKGVFPQLYEFSLDCPVPWLTFREDAMPSLRYLQLKICSGPANQLCAAVPSGITNLRDLNKVVISYSKWCSKSSSVKMTMKAVQEELARKNTGIRLSIDIQEELMRRGTDCSENSEWVIEPEQNFKRD